MLEDLKICCFLKSVILEIYLLNGIFPYQHNQEFKLLIFEFLGFKVLLCFINLEDVTFYLLNGAS
ncbi:hypothetical protein AGMMS49921_05320 [Endomicrobiia bacterium]|nr:hypothetical protein AGMMS49921_05320 [Endomicrobiia bacterium]